MRDLVKERTENLQTIQNLQQNIQRVEQQVKFLSEEKGEHIESSIENLSNRVTQSDRRLEKLESLDIQSVENNNKIDHVKEKQNIMKRFEEQNERMKKLDNKTKQLDKENTNLRQKLSSQTKHVNQLEEKIKNEHVNEGIRMFLEANSKELEKLKKFAEHLSKLHKSLSSWEKYKNFDSFCLEINYEDHESVKEWRSYIDEIKEIHTDEKYFQNLKDIVDIYEESVFPSEWINKVHACAENLDTGVLMSGFYKTYAPFNYKRISVRLFYETKDFENELKKGNWFRISYESASYLEDDCYFLAIMSPYIAKEVKLMNWYDEDIQSIFLPSNGNIVDEPDIDEYSSGDGCILIEVVYKGNK